MNKIYIKQDELAFDTTVWEYRLSLSYNDTIQREGSVVSNLQELIDEIEMVDDNNRAEKIDMKDKVLRTVKRLEGNFDIYEVSVYTHSDSYINMYGDAKLSERLEKLNLDDMYTTLCELFDHVIAQPKGYDSIDYIVRAFNGDVYKAELYNIVVCDKCGNTKEEFVNEVGLSSNTLHEIEEEALSAFELSRKDVVFE